MLITTTLTVRNVRIDRLGGALPIYDNVTGHSATFDGASGEAIYYNGRRSIAIINENVPYLKQREACEQLLLRRGLEPCDYLKAEHLLEGCDGVLVWGKPPGE